MSGTWRKIAGNLGLLVGSYIYAQTSGYVAATIHTIGNRGRI